MDESKRSLPKVALEQQRKRRHNLASPDETEAKSALKKPGFRPDLGPADWRRPVRVSTFMLTTVLLFLTVQFSLTSVLGQTLDQLVLDQAILSFPAAKLFAWPVTRSISLLGIAVITGVALLIAVAKRRFALGLRIIFLVVGANLTTQVIKNFLLDRPYVGVGFELPNSLPSGHVTVAVCAAIALTVVSGQKIRVPVAIVGTGFAGAVSISVVLLGWHRPSDVVAGVLVTFWWALLLIPHERPQGFGTRLNAWLLALYLLVLAGFLAFTGMALESLQKLVSTTVSLPRAPGEVTEAGIPLVIFQDYPWSMQVFTLGSLTALVALVGFVIHFVVLLESGYKNKHYI